MKVRLTKREADVLALVCKGLEPKEIAAKLGTTEQTVRVQLRTLRFKSGCTNRVKLLLWAIQTGQYEVKHGVSTRMSSV